METMKSSRAGVYAIETNITISYYKFIN